MLLFDIGAYKGEFADGLISQGWNVVFVEPNPVLFDGLKNKYGGKFIDYQGGESIPQDGFIVGVQAAASDTLGEVVDFYLCEADTVSTVDVDWRDKSRFKFYTWDKVIRVKTITIPYLVEKFGQPDYIKIDVEGNEYRTISPIEKYVCPLEFEWAVEKQVSTITAMLHLYNKGYNRFRVDCVPNQEKPVGDWLDYLPAMKQVKKFCDQYPGEAWGMIHTTRDGDNG